MVESQSLEVLKKGLEAARSATLCLTRQWSGKGWTQWSQRDFQFILLNNSVTLWGHAQQWGQAGKPRAQGWARTRPVIPPGGRQTPFPLAECPAGMATGHHSGCGPLPLPRRPTQRRYSHFVRQPRVRGERHFKGDLRPVERAGVRAGCGGAGGCGTPVRSLLPSLIHSHGAAGAAAAPTDTSAPPAARGPSPAWAARSAPDHKWKITCPANPLWGREWLCFSSVPHCSWEKESLRGGQGAAENGRENFEWGSSSGCSAAEIGPRSRDPALP